MQLPADFYIEALNHRVEVLDRLAEVANQIAWIKKADWLIELAKHFKVKQHQIQLDSSDDVDGDDNKDFDAEITLEEGAVIRVRAGNLVGWGPYEPMRKLEKKRASKKAICAKACHLRELLANPKVSAFCTRVRMRLGASKDGFTAAQLQPMLDEWLTLHAPHTCPI